jgi:aspartate carbamoyltransferase catalytic subunit
MNLQQTYESLLNRPVLAKLPELQRNERLKHLIFAQQFDQELLEHLGDVASAIRNMSKNRPGQDFLTGLLSHRRAMLYFTQPSTRTFLSFMAACQILGIVCNEIRDPSLSSEYKGESPLDSMRMFSSYFDLIIMRSNVAKFAECCAYLMNDLDAGRKRSVPIINAGSGADEHPTQALLDIYTIQRTFEFASPSDSGHGARLDQLRKKYPALTKGLSGKTYGFCGDVGRGRTVRSLSTLLALWPDVTIYFIYPDYPKLAPYNDMLGRLREAGVRVEHSHNLAEVIGELDVLYMTRIQHEHDTQEDRVFFETFQAEDYRLTPEMLPRMRDYCAIMHPFPRNEEIPFEIDSDPRAMYFRQARNGMWIRAALLAHVFDVDGRILNYYQKHYRSV